MRINYSYIISLIIISYKNYQVFKSFIIKLVILSTIGIVVGISIHDNQPSKYVVDSKDIHYEDASISVDYRDTTVQPEIHITFEKEPFITDDMKSGKIRLYIPKNKYKTLSEKQKKQKQN